MSHRPPSASVLDHFSALSDSRQRCRVLYPLPEIQLLVLCATLSGKEDFVEIRLWGEQRLDFLRCFLTHELKSEDGRNEAAGHAIFAQFQAEASKPDTSGISPAV